MAGLDWGPATRCSRLVVVPAVIVGTVVVIPRAVVVVVIPRTVVVVVLHVLHQADAAAGDAPRTLALAGADTLTSAPPKASDARSIMVFFIIVSPSVS